MELQKSSDAISDYIKRCNNIVHRKGHQIAKEYDLTYDQYHLLIYLNNVEEPPTINGISKKFNRAQNTMSEKVSRLEEKKLISRIDDANDRRIIRVVITEKGIDLIKTIKKERSYRGVYLALSKMEKEEVENLLNNLEKLYNNLDKEV